jgi:hypothetical protein
MRRITILAALFVTTGLSAGDGYVLGQGGYYWSNGYPYTRTLYTEPGYYAYGSYGYQYYPGRSYYQYQQVQNYQPPAAPVYQAPYPAYDKNWRTSVVEAAKAKQDHAQFMEAMQALNLGNAGYGQGFYGANATTQYGGNYSLSSLVQDKGGADMDRLYQYQAQLTQGAQRLAGDAMAGTTSLVQQYGEQRNRAAEILAKAELLKAAVAEPPSTTRTEYYGQSGGQIGGSISNPPPPKPQVPDPLSPGVDPPARQPRNGNGDTAFVALATAKCAACHSGSNVKGGFDVTQYGAMNAERKAGVWARLLTDDPDKLMPRTKDGKPGKRLTADELRLFFNY